MNKTIDARSIKLFVVMALLFQSSSAFTQTCDNSLWLNLCNAYSDCGTMVASDCISDICNQATFPSICHLDGFESCTNFLFSNEAIDAEMSTNFCGPGTGLHNTLWIGFQPLPGTSSVAFDFLDLECQTGGGVQVAIVQIDNADCTAGTVLSCINGTNNDFQIGTPFITPNTKYFILLDGWVGDVCDFRIEVTDGLPSPSSIPITSTGLCTDIAGNSIPTMISADISGFSTDLANNAMYNWYDPNGDLISDQGNMPFISATELGTYTLVVKNETSCCEEYMSTYDLDLVSNISMIPTVVFPNANADGEIVINCDNEVEGVLLSATIEFPMGTTSDDYYWAWYAVDGMPLGDDPFIGMSYSEYGPIYEAGTYIFGIYPQQGGCFYEGTVEVVYEFEEIIDLGVDSLAGTQIHHSWDLTTSSGVVELGANISLKSRTTVELQAGFEAEQGACLSLEIENCEQ